MPADDPPARVARHAAATACRLRLDCRLPRHRRDAMRLPILPLVLLSMVLPLAGCSRPSATDVSASASAAEMKADTASSATLADEHSYAQPGAVRITDVAPRPAPSTSTAGRYRERRRTRCDGVDPHATQLLLDTRDLAIEKVEGATARAVDAPAIRAGQRAIRSSAASSTIQMPRAIRRCASPTRPRPMRPACSGCSRR